MERLKDRCIVEAEMCGDGVRWGFKDFEKQVGKKEKYKDVLRGKGTIVSRPIFVV